MATPDSHKNCVSHGTQVLLELFLVSLTGLSPSLAPHSGGFCYQQQSHLGVLQPVEISTFGLFRFRSPLLTESFQFLFLTLLRCFTSGGYLSCTYEFSAEWVENSTRVTPFGDRLITGCLSPSRRYRRRQRPSSAQTAKASIACFN